MTKPSGVKTKVAPAQTQPIQIHPQLGMIRRGPARTPFLAAVQPACAALRQPAVLGPVRAASYYEVVDGHKRDRKALDAAREAVKGKGDGVISKADTKAILATLVDGQGVTAAEFGTAFVILRDFKFTAPAKKLFIQELALAQPQA